MAETEHDNRELVTRIYAAFGQGEIEKMLEMFADDLAFRHPIPRSIWPWAGNRRGRQELAEFFKGLGETLDQERVEPRQFLADGDTVAVVLSERSRVRATGVFYEIDEVHLFKIKNGEVAALTIIGDTAPVIAALQDRK